MENTNISINILDRRIKFGDLNSGKFFLFRDVFDDVKLYQKTINLTSNCLTTAVCTNTGMSTRFTDDELVMPVGVTITAKEL